jgi:hypothetical protein
MELIKVRKTTAVLLLIFIYTSVVYLTALSVAQTLNALERMWKERSWPVLRHYPSFAWRE